MPHFAEGLRCVDVACPDILFNGTAPGQMAFCVAGPSCPVAVSSFVSPSGFNPCPACPVASCVPARVSVHVRACAHVHTRARLRTHRLYFSFRTNGTVGQKGKTAND